MQITLSIYRTDEQGRATGPAVTCWTGRSAEKLAREYCALHAGHVVVRSVL